MFRHSALTRSTETKAENLETHTLPDVQKRFTTLARQWSELEVRPLPWLPGEFGAFHLDPATISE